MRVLMFSADRALFEGSGIGDALARHQKYADLVGELDVVVFASSQHTDKVVSKNFRVFSTQSRKASHWRKAVERARELTSTGSYDIIVCQDIAAPAGVSVKIETKTPLLISIHSMFFDPKLKGFNVQQWFLSYKIKKSLKGANAFRVNTRATQDKLRTWNFMQPVLVQPTPVNIEKFIVENKERHSVPHILYVGRLSPEKNVEILVRSLKKVKEDFRAKIIGDGPQKNRLEELANGDARFSFVGAESYENLPRYYKEADIFVLPSNSESFGKVLLEAAASQCAIVATRTAGAENILTHEKDALLTPVGDEGALQVALDSLLGDMERQKTLGKQALETARKYSFEEGCERIVDFWKEIAKKSI